MTEEDIEAVPEGVIEDDNYDHDDEAPITPGRSFRRASMLKKNSSRKDHLERLVKTRRASVNYMGDMIQGSNLLTPEETSNQAPKSSMNTFTTKMSLQLTPAQKELIVQESKFIKDVSSMAKDFNVHFPKTFSSVEVKVQDFSYTVSVAEEDTQIQTVYNQSPIHDVWGWVKRVYGGEKRPEKKDKIILDRINLVFKPGKMYLVLGDPETGGKEVLLRAIAGRLHGSLKSTFEGCILYNGVDLRVRRN